MSMREQIADILRGGQLQYIEEDVMAEAILAALPDMIAPLVWGAKPNVNGIYKTDYLHGMYYTMKIAHAGRVYWRVNTEFSWNGVSSEPDAQAAANTHHRAAIMAALTGETS
jgi:hypothetical protein